MKKILIMTAIAGLALTLNAQNANGNRTVREEQCFHKHHAAGKPFCGHGKDIRKQPVPYRHMDPQTMAVHKALRLKEELLLSDKQYEQVYKIYYDAFSEKENKTAKAGKAEQHKPMEEMTDDERKAMHEARKAEREKFVAGLEKQMAKVLNAEQLKRWKENELTASSRSGRHPGGAR